MEQEELPRDTRSADTYLVVMYILYYIILYYTILYLYYTYVIYIYISFRTHISMRTHIYSSARRITLRSCSELTCTTLKASRSAPAPQPTIHPYIKALALEAERAARAQTKPVEVVYAQTGLHPH